MNRKQSAFTLIEILVATAILSLITVLGIGMIRSSWLQGEAHLKNVNVATIESAKEQWALLNNALDGTSVTWEQILPYMAPGTTDLSDFEVGGETITLNEIGTPASYSPAE